MADTIALEIVTPDGIKLSEAVSEFTAASVEGEFGVLPSHRPMLAALSTGIVTYVKNGQKFAVAVGPGFAEIADDKALLLTDHFITKDKIDPVIARKELKDADEALDNFDGDPKSPAYGELVARELWAAVQLDLYGDPPPPRLRTMSELGFGMHETYTQAPEPEHSDGARAPTSSH